MPWTATPDMGYTCVRFFSRPCEYRDKYQHKSTRFSRSIYNSQFSERVFPVKVRSCQTRALLHLDPPLQHFAIPQTARSVLVPLVVEVVNAFGAQTGDAVVEGPGANTSKYRVTQPYGLVQTAFGRGNWIQGFE